jgi:hypothetical protein
LGAKRSGREEALHLVPKLLFGNAGPGNSGFVGEPETRNGVSRKSVPKQEFGNEV